MNLKLVHYIGSMQNAFSVLIVACACLLPLTHVGAANDQSATSKPVASQPISNRTTMRDAPEAGRWKLNRQRSIFEPSPGPESDTLAISVEPGGHHFTIRRVHRDGQVVTEDFVLPMDGKDHDIPGLPRCGTLRAHKLDSLTMNLECKKDGKLLATSVWVISSEGSEMTLVKYGTTPDGRPSRTVATWERTE